MWNAVVFLFKVNAFQTYLAGRMGFQSARPAQLRPKTRRGLITAKAVLVSDDDFTTDQDPERKKIDCNVVRFEKKHTSVQMAPISFRFMSEASKTGCDQMMNSKFNIQIAEWRRITRRQRPNWGQSGTEEKHKNKWYINPSGWTWVSVCHWAQMNEDKQTCRRRRGATSE